MKRLIFFIICFSFITKAYGHTRENLITEFYPTVVKELQHYGWKGPIANEIAKVVMLRQIHEDGLEKEPDYSVPGLSFCNVIKNIVKSIHLKDISCSTVTDNEGVLMFAFKGPNANIKACIIIAKLFDYYILNTSFFNKEQKELWNRTKIDSYLIHNNFILPEYIERFVLQEEERKKILFKCNRLYGPQAKNIEQQLQKLDSVFEASKYNHNKQ